MSTSAGKTPHDPGSPRRDLEAGEITAGRDSREVVARQQERFGGVKVGSAFFGWLTATGTAVLLTAVVAAAGVAVGVATNTTVGSATSAVSSDTRTVGITGAIVVAAILFLAYLCGGYVAGRMARFDGAKQGLAVWLWAVLIAALVAAAAAIAGNKYDILSQLNYFPRIPVAAGTLTSGGVIALVVAALVALVGAVLGGLTGMRYHRRIDDATPDLTRGYGVA